jgi:hypothetical protein
MIATGGTLRVEISLHPRKRRKERMGSEQLQGLVSAVVYLLIAWWVLANTRDDGGGDAVAADRLDKFKAENPG